MMEVRDLVNIGLMLTGVFFMFVGALGLLRMPDLYMRMSATTKSATLGASFVLIAAAVHFGDVGITSRAIATIAFLFMTAPVGAHMIARAAYIRQIKLWEHTHADELKDRYDLQQNILMSHAPMKVDEQKTPSEIAQESA